MDAPKPSGSPERGRTRRRSQVFSLPFSLRSSSKRTSVINSSPEKARCVENAHYPIFDPEDPRHIPSLHENHWRRHESQTSSSESQKPAHEMQNLPQRSVHKARSGFMTRAAEFLRIKGRKSADQVDGIFPVEEHGQGHAYPAVPLSEASTEEDPDFGYELSREVEPRSSTSENHRLDGMTTVVSDMRTVASGHSLNAPIASATLAPRVSQDHDDPTPLDAVRQPRSHYPAFQPSQIREIESHPPGGLERIRETESPVAETELSVADNMGGIGDMQLTESALRMLEEDILRRSGEPLNHYRPNRMLQRFDQFQYLWLKMEGGSGGTSVDSEGPRGRSLEELGFEGGDEDWQSAQYEPEMMDCSVHSSDIPYPDALGTLSSNGSGGSASEVSMSDTIASQEELQRPRSPREIEHAMEVAEGMQRYFADVQLAFPGLHQALVEQWMEDSREIAQALSIESAAAVNAAPAAESNMSDQTSPTAHLTSSHNITEVSESHAHPGPVNQQRVSDVSPFLMAQVQQPTAEEATMPQTSQNSPVGIGGPYSATESVQTTEVPMRSSEGRHSFGLHISLRNGNDGPSELNEPSHRSSPPDNHYSFSSLGLGGVLGSLCDESDFSTNHTRDSTTSAEITSATPISSSAWSPLDSPIDEEVYFSGAVRNEYYMTDGKTSGHRPDRGDMPVKAARRAMGDGTIYSGFGLDRAPSYRTRGMAEMMLEGATRQVQPAMRAMTRSEESDPAEDPTPEHRS